MDVVSSQGFKGYRALTEARQVVHLEQVKTFMPVNPCIILFSTSILFIAADLSIPSNTEKVLCK